MKEKNIVSCSFGKDSLAMLLKMIDDNYKIDEVIFFDTGMEFEAIYRIRDKIIPLLNSLNIVYTELKPKNDFYYMMFDKPVKKRGTNIIHKHGYGWCGGTCRWGTTEKLKVIEKYCKGHNEYVGIAYDEQDRLIKERKGNKKFPLSEWKMTEIECLKYCYSKGFFWEEYEGDKTVRLYDILDRVSCWCCRNKNQRELQGMYTNLPSYWNKLKKIEYKLGVKMKPSCSLDDFEIRYKETGSFNKKRTRKELK